MTDRGQVSGGWGIESTGYDPPMYFYTNPTNFVAVPGSVVGDIDLSWTNPALPDFDHVVVRRKEGGYPSGPTDGDLVYSGTGEGQTDSGRTPGTTYFYGLYAFDTWGIPSSGMLTSSEPLPPDYTAPPDVADFLATPGPAQVELTWTNPVDPDFAGVMIRRSTVGYPATPTDGTLVYSGSGESTIATGLPGNIQQFFTAFAYDAPVQGPPPNYSSPGVHAEATPSLATPTEARLDYKGLIEAMLEAIGEADAAIGGRRMTRLDGVVAKGATDIPVESCLDWPESGKIAIDGVVYYYASRTDIQFSGITHIAGGSEVSGAVMQHRNLSTVTDLSREWSALDLLRRALFVDYAEGEHLSVIGRNLGVNRLPVFKNDDQFREVIKTLAYNPRGTILGLDLALKGIVGSGNYELYEDLLQYPNTVFIRVPTTSFTDNESGGKAFMADVEYKQPSSGVLTLDLNPEHIESVKYLDLDQLFDFREEKPSAVTYPYYPGATPDVAFDFQGTNETTEVLLGGAWEGVKLVSTGPSVGYQMDSLKGFRSMDSSFAEVSWVAALDSGVTIGAGMTGTMSLRDGSKTILVQLDLNGMGLYNGGHLGTPFVPVAGTFYEFMVRKYGNEYVEFWVDGELKQRVDYTAFALSLLSHQLVFAVAGSTMAMEFKQLAARCQNVVDYWVAHLPDGSVNSANPARLTSGTAVFVAGDVGKSVTIRESGIINAFGGNNNGGFQVKTYVSNLVVDLEGIPRENAEADGDQVAVPEMYPFTFPDDLGKKLVISDSELGNDGEYVITKLLEPGTLKDLALDFDTGSQATVKTNVCEVSGGPLTAESGLGWKVEPVFSTESGIAWDLSDAGALVGNVATIRLPGALVGMADALMEIRFSTILSSQVLAESEILTTVVQEDPLRYSYYPFYLSDPLGLLRTYLDELTAAGVIPEFEIE